MARGHVTSAVMAGLATAPLLPDVRFWSGAAWVGLVVGWVLGPDIDSAKSTASRMWGPLSSGVRVRFAGGYRTVVPGLTQIVTLLAGGHRKGTHSVLAVVLVFALAGTGSLFPWGAAVIVGTGTGLFIAALGVLTPGKQYDAPWPVNLGLSVAAGAVAGTGLVSVPFWLPFAMAFGVFWHIVGDAITVAGVSWWYPFSGRTYRLFPIRAGGMFERRVLTPVFVATAVLLTVCYGAGISLRDLIT